MKAEEPLRMNATWFYGYTSSGKEGQCPLYTPIQLGSRFPSSWDIQPVRTGWVEELFLSRTTASLVDRNWIACCDQDQSKNNISSLLILISSVQACISVCVRRRVHNIASKVNHTIVSTFHWRDRTARLLRPDRNPDLAMRRTLASTTCLRAELPFGNVLVGGGGNQGAERNLQKWTPKL